MHSPLLNNILRGAGGDNHPNVLMQRNGEVHVTSLGRSFGSINTNRLVAVHIWHAPGFGIDLTITRICLEIVIRDTNDLIGENMMDIRIEVVSPHTGGISNTTVFKRAERGRHRKVLNSGVVEILLQLNDGSPEEDRNVSYVRWDCEINLETEITLDRPIQTRIGNFLRVLLPPIELC